MIYALLAVSIFLLDLVIKNRVEKEGTEGEEKTIGRGHLLLRKYHNEGAFLNAGEKKRKLVALVSVLLTLAMTVVFLATFSFRGSKLLKTGLALLLGGAYSNSYDRLHRHYVVDYVSFPVKNKAIRRIVFNISDFCIMIGALCMALGSFLCDKKIMP
ncbi:MAG: signal peptidase II [Roseburia sp.]|nr:signal peptidase II [Ruminococcus sp.]MCM1154195.1 signal peptidase II [Roseburia sp.]MCM1241321.1 signal peptidase II [Roseburia sp.]